MSAEKLVPILEGYLKKQSPKGLLVKPWQERYFVLQPNGEILYYASHRTMSEVTGRIKLRTVTEIGISQRNGGCVIAIQATKKGTPRMYMLMAKNSSDARMWLESIEDVRKKSEETDKQGANLEVSTMTMAFYVPDGGIFAWEVKPDLNMKAVKAELFATTKRLGRPIPGGPEDYIVILQTEDPDVPTFFLEDIHGELGQHPLFTQAFAEKQLWKATVKPLAEMSVLKQQLERQRSISQEIEIPVGRSASTSSADLLYLSEAIRSRSRSSTQEKGTWNLPIAETGPYTWAPGTIELCCSYPNTSCSIKLYTMTFQVSPLVSVLSIRDLACKSYSAAYNLKHEGSKFAIKLGGLNVFADTSAGSKRAIGDYKLVQQAASAGEPAVLGLVKVPSLLEDDEPDIGAEAVPSALLKLQFKLKISEVLVSSAESQLKDLGTRDSLGSMYISAGLYYGGETLTNECLLQTSLTYGCATPQWNEWLVFPLSIGSLPQATRLCLSLFYREPSSSSAPKDTPLGWVNLQLMDQKGVIASGKKRLRLWLDGPANPLGTCMDNAGSDSPGALYVQFDDSPLPSIFSQETAKVAP